MSTTGATGGASTTGETSTSTTTQNASTVSEEATLVLPDWTAMTPTTDVYGMFVGAFFVVLSLVVLFATGSIVSVLVLWATIALVLTVMVYYGFLTIDQLLGKVEKKVEKEIEKPFVPSMGGPLVGSEVFHVADQAFTYDEAAAVCAAYGSELATLEQIMDAFAHGAEWCSYGWSAGGMALYPTQRETWERLQAEVDYGKRTRCGRPGVNGGYFDPTMKFGVNCFGIKPRGDFTPPAPVPGIDTKRFGDMVNRFKEMLKGFTLNPYSRLEWSEYGNPSPKKEAFTVGGGGLFDMFKQEFFTPYGVRENLENATTQNYVEPVGQYGLGQGASPLRGPIGLMGDRGEKGDTGPPGPVGPAGAQGGVGPAGPQGIAGTPGDRGPTGPKGDKGEKGDQGERGPVGTGAAGGVGPKGDKGDKGEKGDRGADGPRGPQGAQGPKGDKGDAGVVPRDLDVNTLKVGDWRLSSTVQGGNPVLDFTNVSKNHKAAQIFTVGTQGVVRATNTGSGYRDIWSG